MKRATLIAAIAFSLTTPLASVQSLAANNTTTESAAKKADEVNLGITPETFSTRFNIAAKSMKEPLRIPAKPHIDRGDVNDSIKVMLTDHIAVIGTVSKQTGLVKEMTLLGSGDGTAKSGLQIMFASAVMFMAASNSLDKEGKKTSFQLVMDLLKKLDESPDKNRSAETYRNGLLYGAFQMEGMGTWFTVSAES